MPGLFKQCPLCKKEWSSEADFLKDRSLQLNGYQFAGTRTMPPFPGGYLLFTHSIEGCGTTLAVYAKAFKEVERNKTVQHSSPAS